MTATYCILQVGIGEAGDALDIFHDLRQNFPARFGVSPQFDFNEYEAAIWCDEEVVDITVACWKFHAHGNEWPKRRLYLIDRYEFWVSLNDLLEPFLAER